MLTRMRDTEREGGGTRIFKNILQPLDTKHFTGLVKNRRRLEEEPDIVCVDVIVCARIETHNRNTYTRTCAASSASLPSCTSCGNTDAAQRRRSGCVIVVFAD